MEIKSIKFNWHPVNDGYQQTCCYEEHIVGQKGVVEILEHSAKGEGDKWFYHVMFQDGHEQKIFNPNSVITI